MGANIGTVEGTLRLRDLFNPPLNESRENLEKWGKQVEKLGKRMTNVGAKLTAAVTLPIVGVGAAAIKMATDAVEAENLFAESFGDMADAARKWSEDTGKALRLNRVELRKQAATIFVMSESMGVARDQAFDMATGITKLAGDMASFYNLDTEDAFAKLRAGLTGEAEPLKRLGILVDEATIKTAAYRHGLVEVGDELTNVQKVQARYLAIMDQTSKAQGDLARTLESPANRLRALKTRFEEILISLGTALLPAFERLLGMVDALAQKIEVAAGFFSNLPPPMQAVTVALAGIAAAAGPVLVVTGQLVIAWGALAVASPGLAAGIISVGTAIKTALLGPLGLALAAVTALTVVIKKWSDEQGKETARIVASADKVRVAHEKTFDAINSGSLKTMEIQRRMLIQQRGSIEMKIKELEASKRLAESDARIARGRGQAVGIKMAQERVEELSEAIRTLRSEEVGLGRDQAQLNKHMEIFKQVLGEELPGTLTGIRRELEKLKEEASKKGLAGEVKRLEGAIQDVDKQMKDSAGSGGGAGDLMSAYEDLEAQSKFLRDQIDAMGEFGLSAEESAEMVRILMDPKSKNRSAEEILLLIERNRELQAELEKAIALQEKQRNMPPPTIGDNVPRGTVVGSQGDFFEAVGANAQAEAYADAMAKAEKSAEEWRKVQEKNLEMAYRSADTWQDVGRAIARVFDDMGSDLGDLIAGLGDAAAAWKRYAAAKRADDTAGMESAQTDAYGSMWSAVGSYMGSALAGGGTSTFGGELGGTYSQEGAEIGGMFGPVWGAVGAILGGFIEKAGDEARVSLENFGDQIAAGVDFAEGGLGDAANTLAAGMNDFIRSVEAQLGISLPDTGGLTFQFMDTGVLEVRIAGLVNGFRDLGEAMGWAAEQLLRINAETADVGDNMRSLLSSLGRDGGIAESMEELQAALALAQEADRGAMGEQLAAMQAITRQRQIDLELAQKYGLAYEDVLAVTDRRIAQLREEVEAMRAGLFGTRDFASQALELVRAMEAFNAGVEAETNSRQRALDAARALSAGLDEVGQEARDALDAIHGGGGSAGSPFDQAAGQMGRAAAGARDLAGGVDTMTGALRGSLAGATGMIEAFEGAKKARYEERRELWGQISDQERARESIDALVDSLGNIPEAFSAQEISDVWTKAASDAGLALLSLIRQVRGAEFGAAQERQLMTDIFRLQLAVQLQAVYQLLAAAETLQDSTRAILTDLAAQAEQILGDPNLRIRRGRGPSQRQQEEERAAEQMVQDVERLNDMLRQSAREGMTDYARALDDIQTGWDEAVPLAHENQALLDQIAAARRREVDALREQTRGDLAADIAEFADNLSGIQGSIDGVNSASRELTDRVQEAMEGGLLNFVEGIESIQDILIATNEQLYRISRSGFADLAGSLAEVVQDEALRNELIAQQEQINFILQMERLRAEYQALLGLGMLTRAQVDLLESAFAWVDSNMDSLLAAFELEGPSATTGIFGGGGGGGTGVDATSSYEDLLEKIQEGIDAWMNLGVGDATRGARQILSDLRELQDLLDQTLETGSARAVREYADNLAAVNEAFEYVVGAFVDEVLEPFEDSGLSDLEQEYADLQSQFWDIAQAFEELGLGAEEMARLTAAQQQALAAFWDDATSGVQDIIERLTGVESGRAPLDLLAEQQADVEDLFARAMSGDLAALEELGSEADDLLDLIDQVYGSGRAGGILRDQLLAMLEEVAGLDPSEVLDSSQGEAAPAFDIADYFLSSSGTTGIQADIENALQTHRAATQEFERERDRAKEAKLDELHRMDIFQRDELIRLTRDIGKVPLKEGGQMGV